MTTLTPAILKQLRNGFAEANPYPGYKFRFLLETHAAALISEVGRAKAWRDCADMLVHELRTGKMHPFAVATYNRLTKEEE